jgi:hypothetical protein
MRIVERHVLNISKDGMGFVVSACSFAISMTFAASLASAQSANTATGASTSAPGSASTSTAAGTPAGGSSTLPRVNVVGSKPGQKTDQRTAATGTGMSTQSPYKIKHEPIKEPVTQTGCKPAMSPGKPYFVEFRSRGAQSYGHTFVFHGRLGPGNKFASFSVAGLHPAGEDPATYIQGHWAPVPAETGVSYGDLDEQYLTARFCVTLNEVEYRKALAFIKNLQATKRTWHAGTYNCNSFAADIAKAIGLDVPNPNMYLPERFINRLAEDNPRGKKADAATAFSNWMQPAKQR